MAEATANVVQIAACLQGEPLIIMFSTGKDSIVMSDMLMRHYSGRKEFVFLYFVPDLGIKRRLI